MMPLVKCKFQLALKVATDPVTAAGVALVSASKQAGDTPNYGQGWGGYGERVSAVGADGFSDIMIGGAPCCTRIRGISIKGQV
jgi:hypothetical protein